MKDGGPAFPNTDGLHIEYGMSLRDYFAGEALSGQLANGGAMERLYEEVGEDIPKAISSCAYSLADAMLKARKESR